MPYLLVSTQLASSLKKNSRGISQSSLSTMQLSQSAYSFYDLRVHSGSIWMCPRTATVKIANTSSCNAGFLLQLSSCWTLCYFLYGPRSMSYVTAILHRVPPIASRTYILHIIAIGSLKHKECMLCLCPSNRSVNNCHWLWQPRMKSPFGYNFNGQGI